MVVLSKRGKGLVGISGAEQRVNIDALPPLRDGKHRLGFLGTRKRGGGRCLPRKRGQ